MKHFRVLVIPACVVLLPACTDYATFVTSTDIGISADINTQELHLGYVRTELFVGPGYPEYGAAPAAVGYLGSNLSVFSPKIKQLYATGDAAEAVTQDHRQGADQQAMQIQSQAAALAAAAIRADNPQGPPPGTLAGQRRPLVFGTGSNIGVQLGFTGGTPSKVKFGYNREELSIIPFRAQTPTTQSPDKYAPVLAAIDMDLSTPNLPETELVLTQFFATGVAAKNLARNQEIQKLFEKQAKEAITKVSQESSYNDLSQRIEAYWKPNGKADPTRAARLLQCMVDTKVTGRLSDLIDFGADADKQKIAKCVPV